MASNERKRILVVEDDVAMSVVLEFNLEQAGFDVVHAANGEIAFQRCRLDTFDLVISDQQMPVMIGLEFCRLFRDTEQGRDVPIVLLTAKKLEMDADQLARELGISEVIGKPFSPKAVVRLAREVTNQVCDDVPA